MKANNKSEILNYDLIPTVNSLEDVNLPGCYCKNCGRTFALYSFSAFRPSLKDENNKLYYENCFKCKKDERPK